MATSWTNMAFLRSISMGSIRAWLPSRKSTLHQRGARVRRLLGHVRSGRSTGTVGWYLANAMGLGCWVLRAMFILSLRPLCEKQKTPA
jgi:hypothetical protein